MYDLQHSVVVDVVAVVVVEIDEIVVVVEIDEIVVVVVNVVVMGVAVFVVSRDRSQRVHLGQSSPIYYQVCPMLTNR